MQYRFIKTILLSSLIIGEAFTVSASSVEQTLVGIDTTEYLSCVDETEPEIEEQLATEYEINLIAVVTMGEAEGESEEGKRLVIDTILNRVDSEYFPNTIEEVIYQSNAYECMWNGRIYDCWSDEDICRLVREELEYRTNDDVIYFTAGRYGKYGEPLFQVGNHYFSSY